MSAQPLHLAVALDGAGWHPGAWREPSARPHDLFTAAYWVDLVREAERGTLDFVTIEDGLGVQSQAADQVRGRLDAVLIAARVAPLTRHIGLMPTATVTHTEPFHISKAIATLDYVSSGRAGWRAQVSARPEEAAHFGRRTIPADPAGELLDEAADFVEVVRRLWDSWEDDAEIRDAATGRFVDRDRLHYIDFQGTKFRVKGPSITPRPPQGQPVVAVLAHGTAAYRLGARSADIIFVTPEDTAQVRAIVAEIRALNESVHIFADLDVAFPATGLADRLLEWQAAGLTGFRLKPAVLPRDLEAITRELVPELRARGAFRHEYEASTLRGLLGLSRPANRFATELR